MFESMYVKEKKEFQWNIVYSKFNTISTVKQRGYSSVVEHLTAKEIWHNDKILPWYD